MQPNSQLAPEGSKMWLLHVGNMEADEGIFMPLANASSTSNPNPTHARRSLVMISVLIEHPDEGLILFETGAGKDYPEIWGPQLVDLFARVDYTADMELDAAIKKTNHDIKDVKAVVIGHLHIDHAGGLEHFRKTDIPIYVHELELKHAFYSVASKTDLGLYLPSYLQFDLNWKPFYGETVHLAPGLLIHHCPGHTPGQCVLQLNLPNSGSWIFTSDHYVVREHFETSMPQGWLTRDYPTWCRSNQMLQFLAKATKAKLIFGHDRETLQKYKVAPEFYD